MNERRGRGRPRGTRKYPESTAKEGALPLSVRLEPALRAWVLERGGAPWVRSLILLAQDQKPPSACGVESENGILVETLDELWTLAKGLKSGGTTDLATLDQRLERLQVELGPRASEETLRGATQVACRLLGELLALRAELKAQSLPPKNSSRSERRSGGKGGQALGH